MFTPRKSDERMSTKDTYDVTLSVWNIFRNREQRQGFEAAGLSVHWIGNHCPPSKNEVAKRSFAWLSFIVLMSNSFIFRKRCLVYLHMYLFDFYSGTRKLNTKLVWAYVEMNTRLIRRAKAKGIPVVLDNPIAHMRDYYDILKPEYAALGMEFHDKATMKWVRRAEEEYANSNWFNVGSNFVKQSLVRRGIPADRIVVNHTGVDLEKWKLAHTNRTHNREKTTFVYTGSLIPRKGVHYLVSAWIKAGMEDAELFVCGGETMPWEKICDTLPENIHIMGSVKHDTLIEIYSNSDVYVLPSLLEGFARSGLEAMAAGLPLIITEETGLIDVCDDGIEGWVVPSKNVDALAERLIWCYNHPEQIRTAGEKAFNKMQGRDFGAYGKKCADMAKTIIEGTNAK